MVFDFQFLWGELLKRQKCSSVLVHDHRSCNAINHFIRELLLSEQRFVTVAGRQCQLVEKSMKNNRRRSTLPVESNTPFFLFIVDNIKKEDIINPQKTVPICLPQIKVIDCFS